MESLNTRIDIWDSESFAREIRPVQKNVLTAFGRCQHEVSSLSTARQQETYRYMQQPNVNMFCIMSLIALIIDDSTHFPSLFWGWGCFVAIVRVKWTELYQIWRRSIGGPNEMNEYYGFRVCFSVSKPQHLRGD